MKTEVEFRELPEKVQRFLIRMFGDTFSVNCIVTLYWLHNLSEWKDATDEERLAYAEWRYPDGTIALFGEVKRRADVRWPLIITDTGTIGDSNSPASAIYRNTVNKWAEIISTPDEAKEPLFKVGDRPQWTPELIKQLPYGTVLRCAFFIEDIFAYNGQKIECDSAQDIFVDSFYFTFKKRNRYAEILSLPDIKEASPEAQKEFVKANPGMQHIEEPKAGDMVEGSYSELFEHIGKGTYTGGKTINGFFIVEKEGGLHLFSHIRLPHKSEVESKAKEILETWIDFGDDAGTIEVVTNAIKSAIKWGQANPDKK